MLLKSDVVAASRTSCLVERANYETAHMQVCPPLIKAPSTARIALRELRAAGPARCDVVHAAAVRVRVAASSELCARERAQLFVLLRCLMRRHRGPGSVAMIVVLCICYCHLGASSRIYIYMYLIMHLDLGLYSYVGFELRVQHARGRFRDRCVDVGGVSGRNLNRVS